MNSPKPLADRDLIRFDGYELDPCARCLKRDGKPVPLSSKTFDLLFYLAENSQQVVTKDRLLAAIWPDSFVEESNLSQHVFLLRKALAAGGDANRFVVTVPGKGYQFTASIERLPVNGKIGPSAIPASAASIAGSNGFVMHAVRSVTRVVMEEETDDELPAEKALPAPPARRGRRFWTLVWTGTAAAALLLAGASFTVWRRMHPSRTGRVDMVLSEIENTTGDPDFDHTLNQALQIDLEQSPYLNLLSRSSIHETLAQMQRKSSEVLTPALAREICERNNAQAVLNGTLSRLGSRYLILLDADSCVSGKKLAAAKADVSSKEEVLVALESAASQVRRQLGESDSSRERYQIPIAPVTTPSLDALRAYSEAGDSFWRGDMKGAQILLNRAVALDPNFASAYRALGSSCYNLGDFTQASIYYKKAYDLREFATERERLGIEVMYYGYGLNDYEESIRRTRQFLQIYPNVANSWVSLSNLYARLGERPQAIDAAEHAHSLDPHSSVATVELARSYLRASRFADAKRVADAAIAEGKDHWDFHSILFQIAFAEGDAARMKSEGEWGLTHQHSNTSLKDLAFAAASQGKLREAGDDFARARTEALRSGETDFANDAELDLAHIFTEFEQPGKARESLKQLQQNSSATGNPDEAGKVAVLEALDGDFAGARRFVAAAGAVDDRNTMNVYIYVPLVRALLSLQTGKPAVAVQSMEPARPYQLADFEIPYLRAQAETASGMMDAAAADYRLILNNRGVCPISPIYALAHFRLARVLVLQKKPGEARTEYKAFLDAWKNADVDLELLKMARKESAALTD